MKTKKDSPHRASSTSSKSKDESYDIGDIANDERLEEFDHFFKTNEKNTISEQELPESISGTSISQGIKAIPPPPPEAAGHDNDDDDLQARIPLSGVHSFHLEPSDRAVNIKKNAHAKPASSPLQSLSKKSLEEEDFFNSSQIKHSKTSASSILLP